MIGKFIVGAGTALIVAATAGPVLAATSVRTIGCFQRNHDYIEALFEKFIKPLNAEKGVVSIDYLGGPEVTPRQKQAQAVRRGVVDMIFCPGAYYGGQLAAARIPGVQNRPLAEIRKNGGWDIMQQAWEKGLNAHIVAWPFHNSQKFYVYMRIKPKLSTKTGLDLKGVKMRGTGLYRPFMKAMGATVIVISPGDVFSAMERGLVEGMAWPWGSVHKYGWQKFLKYRIKPSFYGASMLLIANLDKWKSLSKAEQDMLVKFGRKLENEGDELLIKQGEQDDAELKKAGVEDLELTGEVRKAYLRTIYGAKWEENDGYKYNVDYQALKTKLFEAGE